jgi:hypothetical protein
MNIEFLSGGYGCRLQEAKASLSRCDIVTILRSVSVAFCCRMGKICHGSVSTKTFFVWACRVRRSVHVCSLELYDN